MALLLATSTPILVAGHLKEFGDWAVGCDNGRDCHATSLQVKEVNEEPRGNRGISMAIKRSGHPGAAVSISFTRGGAETIGDNAPADAEMQEAHWIVVDNRKVQIDLSQSQSIYELDKRAAVQLIAAMRGNTTVGLFDRRGRPLGMSSLRGLNEALEYIDQQQYLSDTEEALAPPGKKPFNVHSIPPLVSRQSVTVAGIPDTPPSTVDKMQVARLRDRHPCSAFRERISASYHRLDKHNTLMILDAVCSARNRYGKMYIIDEKRKVRPALFWDRLPLISGQNEEFGLPNIIWRTDTRRLRVNGGSSRSDCNNNQEYVWYEAQFKLVRFESMPFCRGSTDYITTYRIDVFIDDHGKRRRVQ